MLLYNTQKYYFNKWCILFQDIIHNFITAIRRSSIELAPVTMLLQGVRSYKYGIRLYYINPLTPELNPSVQHFPDEIFYWGSSFLNRAFRGAWLSEIAMHHATRHNTPNHNILSTAPQLSLSQKAVGTLPEDGCRNM
jgi:hypothetical protein